ncbi:MAG: hypothetical protein IT292_03935 [Deltaproteobacteria bacterium]|nr:hypothetical protein [Deltaproteobacteria bacterium]
MASFELKNKQKIKFFEDGMRADNVLVHLDSRQPNVKVPDNLMNNHSLTLKLSYLFQGKTTHNDDGISTYLKFGSDYFECTLPWASIWGMTKSSGSKQIWPEDLPHELLLEYTKKAFSELANTGRAMLKNNKKTTKEKKKTDAPQPPASPNDRRKLLKLIK